MNKTNHFLIVLLSSIFLISGYELKAQLSYKVLFLGNSYTYVNDLPQILHDVALSAGDTLIFDSYTPGGYHLSDHCTDVNSQAKIMMGDWDYVIIQGQSQEPITSTGQFNSGGIGLHDLVKQYNPCAVLVPYMTWGRKNGDASNCPWFPVMCTYQGMDSTLRKNYLELTASINGEVSPVSVVWNYIRQNYPGIELYDADESHPSVQGSYAAACSFYSAIFKKDPTLITFDFGLNANDASIIRNAAKTQAFDSLPLWDFKKPPIAEIRYQRGTGSNEINFQAIINYTVRQTYLWDFGDGDTSSSRFPTHSYLTDGTYTVTLTTTTCDLQGLHTSFADTIIQLCNHTPTVYTSQPVVCYSDTLWTQTADSYQWFADGLPIPETNQYVANYSQYANTGFSVISTLNGCSELSGQYTDSPQWSGYYFDIWAFNDPCVGDTAQWMVLHTSGSLSGFESILWYRNDTLLASMTNEDTLYITQGGTYDCKVIDPTSICPLDTTFYRFVFDCGTTGIENNVKDLSWSIFPNPASETITIKFLQPMQETIQIYSAVGRLIKTINSSAATTKINIADLPNGLYYVRLKNNKQAGLKFIKL